MSNPSPIFVFDALGTLFDVHSAARTFEALLGDKLAPVSDTWRTKQLEYTWIYAGMYAATGRPAPTFRELTRRSLDYALAQHGVDGALAPRILDAYQRLAAFADVPGALDALRRAGARLAILSNADPDQLDDLVHHAGLDGAFDTLLSVHEAGTFKPVPRVYALATEAFGCAPNDVVFVSSNRWDVAGAKAFGFTPVWVNRARRPDEYPDLPPVRVIDDLSALIEFV